MIGFVFLFYLLFRWGILHRWLGDAWSCIQVVSFVWVLTVWCSLGFSSVQFNHSVVSNSLQPWTAARQASLSITNCWSLPKPMTIESVMPSNHLILCRPLLLPPSVFPRIRVFSNESALCTRWPKCSSFSFNISPSNEHPGLIFRMDWLDLLAVQATLQESSPTPQFKSINSSALSFLYCPTHIHTLLLEKL